MKILLILLCLALYPVITSGSGIADHSHHHQAKISAPIGVMGEHLHGPGGWMFSYRTMHMSMDGNLSGTDSIRESQILDQGYMITPTSMSMDMHMLGVMYGMTDDLTLMIMLPYLDKEMKHLTASGTRFSTRSEGSGDIQLNGLYRLGDRGPHALHMNAGISLPTGSIDVDDTTPAGANQHLPYPMQLGSGTIDLLPGITYLGRAETFSWGAQAVAVIRSGENDNDYRLGNHYQLSGWLSRDWSKQLNLTARLTAAGWGNIRGDDSKLPPMAANMVPTADPDRRGGRRVDISLGMNINIRNSRLAVELGFPAYQDLEGPQLESDWTLVAGWQYPL